MVSVITVQPSLNLEFHWYLILLEKTHFHFSVYFTYRNIKKRNIFYEKLWMKLYLNDGKIQVVCWLLRSPWGLKNVYDSGILRSLQWLYDLIHHTVQCVLCTEGRQSFSWFHSHLQLCLDFQEIKRMQDYYCWCCQFNARC